MSSKIIWSEYQKNIFKEVADGTSNLIVEAKAGSAKTSSLLESLKYIQPDKKILVVAFNKKIALELQERAPEYANLDISTLHSFGYKMIRKAFGKVKLDTEKSFKIIKEFLEPYKSNKKAKDDYETIYEMRRCVSLCKSLIADTPDQIDEVLDNFGISNGSLDRETFIKVVIAVLGECKKRIETIDYDDMIYVCFALNLPIDKYDRVLIDEVQDLTAVQIYIATNACKKDGKIMAYGDHFQVLYAWNGADLDIIPKLQKKLNAKTLSLPISYRCAKNIVCEAQKIVPEIKFAPNAKDGKINYITDKELMYLVKPGDFVLSRTNAPLISICFDLWRNKIPASIKGKDIGSSLTALIKQSNKKTIKSLMVWLNNWVKEECERLKTKNRSISSVMDRYECLCVLAEGKENIQELFDTMKTLFENKEDGVVHLSTVHGAKGLESNRVFFLKNTMVFGNDKQEKNIEYVAITRAKDELFIINNRS